MQQVIVRLLRFLFLFRNQHRNIKSLILLSQICSRCLLKSVRNQIYSTSKRFNSFQKFFISSKLRSTSGLQPITASRLVKTRKFQIRWVFNSIRSRNRIVSNSHLLFSTSDLRNRSFYYTNYRLSPVYLSQRYRAFRSTKCRVSHAFNQWSHFANSRLDYLFHLFLESFSIFQILVTSVASAAIFSNRTIACIDIYERFISVKRLVLNSRALENAIISVAISKILDLLTEKWSIFLLFTMYY